MSLPKPYYEDEARGIVIYHGANRVYLPHETRAKARLQTVAGAYFKEEKICGRSPIVERGRSFCKVGKIACTKTLQANSTLFKLLQFQGRTPSPRRQHSKQLYRKYSMALQAMSHERGWTIKCIGKTCQEKSSNSNECCSQSSQAYSLPEGARIHQVEYKRLWCLQGVRKCR